MMQVYEKEDVTCVKMDIVLGGNTINTVYAFLVDGMLIDTGPKHSEAELIPFYENHSIDFVALTHSYEDHTGTAPWIQENLEVPLYIHPKGIGLCTQDYPYPRYRQLTWGKREGFEAMPLGDTIQSRNREWQVIYTPGHADDHVSLLDEETGTLFSGDLFVAAKTKVIMHSESIPVIMDPMRVVPAYDCLSTFRCHAVYVESGKKTSGQKLDNLETPRGEVNKLHKEGLPIEDIKEPIVPRKDAVIGVSQGQWDSLHIV